MTEDYNKKVSEKKHRRIQNMLVKTFPDCDVKYDGVEGVDHKITHDGKTTLVETKTVREIIYHGVKLPEDESPYLVRKVRLGRIQFNRREHYPYDKSQHEDLVDNGWYVFVIGKTLVAGAPASDINKLLQKLKSDQISWSRILALCHPDWLDNLKKQVYQK